MDLGSPALSLGQGNAVLGLPLPPLYSRDRDVLKDYNNVALAESLAHASARWLIAVTVAEVVPCALVGMCSALWFAPHSEF